MDTEPFAPFAESPRLSRAERALLEPHAGPSGMGDDAPTHAVHQTGASRGAVSAADMAPAGRGERIR